MRIRSRWKKCSGISADFGRQEMNGKRSATRRALLICGNRLAMAGSANWYARFVSNMALYFEGCMCESRNRALKRTPSLRSIEPPASERRNHPCFDLIEIAGSGELPKEVQDNPALPLLRIVIRHHCLGQRHRFLPKESAFSDPHNIVTVLREEVGFRFRKLSTRSSNSTMRRCRLFRIWRKESAQARRPARRHRRALQWMRGVRLVISVRTLQTGLSDVESAQRLCPSAHHIRERRYGPSARLCDAQRPDGPATVSRSAAATSPNSAAHSEFCGAAPDGLTEQPVECSTDGGGVRGRRRDRNLHLFHCDTEPAAVVGQNRVRRYPL